MIRTDLNLQKKDDTNIIDSGILKHYQGSRPESQRVFSLHFRMSPLVKALLFSEKTDK